jgi:nicotinate-nucleotide pyrophosphorylase
MIILGHKFFENEKLYTISSFEQIKNTPTNSTLLLNFQENDILNFIKDLKENSISFALEVQSIKELIFANNFGAKFILLEEFLAVDAQKIANEYLFDSKILVKINSEEEIEKLALLGIDGVVFNEAIC